MQVITGLADPLMLLKGAVGVQVVDGIYVLVCHMLIAGSPPVLVILFRAGYVEVMQVVLMGSVHMGGSDVRRQQDHCQSDFLSRGVTA